MLIKAYNLNISRSEITFWKVSFIQDVENLSNVIFGKEILKQANYLKIYYVPELQSLWKLFI